jgi:hypothetical protein
MRLSASRGGVKIVGPHAWRLSYEDMVEVEKVVYLTNYANRSVRGSDLLNATDLKDVEVIMEESEGYFGTITTYTIRVIQAG